MFQVTCWVAYAKCSRLITVRHVDEPVLGKFGCKAIIKIASVAPDSRPTLAEVTSGGCFSVE